MVRAFSAYLDFCYIVRRASLLEEDLDALDAALTRFHLHRKIFEELGVRPDGISLPRQHAMVHYREHIENFGAPNGLCTSITESKHIKAVKKPWRRSSRFQALGQMLVTNQRIDKMAAARVDFSERGMLDNDVLTDTLAAIAVDPLDSDSDSSSSEDASGEAVEVQQTAGQVADEEEDMVMSFVTLAKTKGAYSSVPQLFSAN